MLFVLFAFTIENTMDKRIALITVTLIFASYSDSSFYLSQEAWEIVDVDASVKEERTFPFLIAVLFYVAADLYSD